MTRCFRVTHGTSRPKGGRTIIEIPGPRDRRVAVKTEPAYVGPKVYKFCNGLLKAEPTTTGKAA